MAREEDETFVRLMNELEAPLPKASLATQTLTLEYRLIFTSFFAITSAWIVSYIFLSHVHILLIYFLAMCNAISLEYLLLTLVTKLSFRPKSGSGSIK